MNNLFTAYDRTDIDIVGVGGVSTGKDVFELILCGAKVINSNSKFYDLQ